MTFKKYVQISGLWIGILFYFLVSIIGCGKEATKPEEPPKAAKIVLSPEPVFMGQIPVGSGAERSILIFNNGEESATVQNVELTGADTAFFNLQGTGISFPRELQPLEFLEIVIHFLPSEAREYLSVLKIQTTVGVFEDSISGRGTTMVGGIAPFERIIGSQQDDYGSALTYVPGTGYFLVGSAYASAAEDYPDIYLVATDDNGQVLWQKLFGGDDVDNGLSILRTSDNHLLILARTNSFGAGGEDAYLIKTDLVGNEIWSKTIGGPLNDAANQIIPVNSGGFILLGSKLKDDGQDRDGWVVRLDEDGNELWSRTYGESSGGENFFAALEASDGKIYLVGSTTSKGAGEFDVYLIQIDASGNFLWDKTFGGVNWEEAYNVAFTPDGNLVLCGYTASMGAGARDVYLIKVDSSGNLLWQKTYGTERSETAQGLVVDNQGNIYLSGSAVTRVTSQAQYTDAYLLKVDNDGQLVWSILLGGEQNESIGNLLLTQNGGIAGVGGTNSFGKSSDLYFIHITPDGTFGTPGFSSMDFNMRYNPKNFVKSALMKFMPFYDKRINQLIKVAS